ncbi:MAG: SH3 domain-containing protein [Oscillochloridaceae bacterium umkhey_bin13]
MSDPRRGQGRGKTQRLHDEVPGGDEVRRTERLSPDGDEWREHEPVNPDWRKERTGSSRAPRRGALPSTPQEFQLWLQSGGWRYMAGIGVLLVVLLIAMLAFSRNDQREAGVLGAPTASSVNQVDPALGTLPADGLPTVTAEPPTPAPPARFVVSGTGGQGLFLRPQPSTQGSPLTTLPDGTVVEQVGEDVTGSDRLWREVRAPDGQQGYVAADFLTPAP